MVLFCDTLGVYGGSQTLLLRMCTWLSDKGYNTAVLCADDSNTEIVAQLIKIGIKIIKCDVKNVGQITRIIKNFAEVEPIRAISFGWNNYIGLEMAKKKGGLEFDNLIYCIHPNTFKRGLAFKNRFLKKYAKWTFGDMYKRMVNNKAVIMMDEVNLQQTHDYLEIKESGNVQIVRLPMICKESPKRDEIINDGYSNDVIISAARAEFPMKGYLMGLIDDFEKLKEEYPKLKLEIISAGDDLPTLRDRVEMSPNRDSIILHGWMTYDKLGSVIRKGTVYIGMGTSVLDAALQYKPAIAVNFNTFNCYADDTISNLPEFIDTKDVNCTNPAIDIIRDILNLNFEQYKEECIRSFFSVKKVYDIDINIEKILTVDTIDKGCILTRFEIIRQHINNVLIKWRTRNMKLYDYKTLYKEP